MTDTLAARLLAAIAETERVARDAETACWHVDYCDDRGKPFHRQQTPEQVLRRCAADRKILDRHTRPGSFEQHTYGVPFYRCLTCHAPMPCPDLVDLAEGYGIEETPSHDDGLDPGYRDDPDYDSYT